ncbi:MAG: hypothetical protein M1823_006603, partial [Watsoniomyces obsoletus]
MVRDSRGHRALLAVAGDWRITPDALLEAEMETSRRSQPTQPGFSLLGNTVPRPGDPRLSLNNMDLDIEDANIPGTLLSLRQRNIKFSKQEEEDLPARIERIWYINPYGQEMLPPANPRAVSAIKQAQAIIYSIGSLYTSIVPSIVPSGMGEALRATPARHKILILNGSLDREVGPSTAPFTAFDFVEAIARAGEQSRGQPWRPALRMS